MNNLKLNKLNFDEFDNGYVYKRKDKENIIDLVNLSVIEKYCSASCEGNKMNALLRNNSPLPNDLYELAKGLDSLFYSNASINEYPFTVYRGISFSENFSGKQQDLLNLKNILMKKDTSVKTFIDRAFTSTSTDKNIANTFASDCGLLLEIVIPPYSKYLDIQKLSCKSSKNVISNIKKEKEILLPRNSKFKVVDYNALTKTVKVEYLGEVEPKPKLSCDNDFCSSNFYI